MSCKETGIGKADTLSAIHVQLFYFNYFNEIVFLIGKESVGPPLRTFFFYDMHEILLKNAGSYSVFKLDNKDKKCF